MKELFHSKYNKNQSSSNYTPKNNIEKSKLFLQNIWIPRKKPVYLYQEKEITDIKNIKKKSKKYLVSSKKNIIFVL